MTEEREGSVQLGVIQRETGKRAQRNIK